MKLFFNLRRLATPALAFAFVAIMAAQALPARAAADKEYIGKLDAELKPDQDELDEIIFKPIRDLSKIKFATPLEAGGNVTAGRLYHPPQDKSSILTLLVEPEDGEPYLYADLNLDNLMAQNERFALKRGDDDSPYLWEATLNLPLQGVLFPTYPVYVRYLKNVQWDKMKEGERLLQQSKTAFARGTVDIEGHKTLVQYVYTGQSKKISTTNGWLGVDTDGDGKIIMHPLSPEAALAHEETVVFRVGQTYVSTKRVDVEKNEIALRANQASDYKRVELRVGSELPDFPFTDFNGKKRKLSEFRGKYVLLDFWGTWCPACVEELPYLKTAYSRFQARGFEIIGMNTDGDPSFVKSQLKSNGLMWTQATLDSIKDVVISYRVSSYPTTMLIGPDGKIISLNQKDGSQPELRGRDLLATLDQILPP
jgi:peroxiredoxin